MLTKIYRKVKQRGIRVQNIIYKVLNNGRHKEELKSILKQHPTQTIVILPPLVDWNIPLFQRPQHLAKSMSQHNILYFYTTSSKLYDRVNSLQQISENCYLTNRFDLVDNRTGRRKYYDLSSTDNGLSGNLLSKDLKMVTVLSTSISMR